MSRSEESEELSYTNPTLIVKVREKLVGFLTSILDVADLNADIQLDVNIATGRVLPHSSWMPKRVAVVDGGSNMVSLNAGYLGIVASLGIVIENSRVVDKIIGEPEIVPSSPSELKLYETTDQITSIIDKIREAKVFEVALKLLDKDPDILIIDGPLIPYGALGKIVVGSTTEREALQRYRNAVLALHRRALEKKTSIIGFVKRPRSRYLSKIWNTEASFDNILLSRILREGEFYPNPPFSIPIVPEWFHEKSILDLIEKIKPRFTFLRLSKSAPPYRIDFGHLTHNYEEILSYIYATKTREGIPYVIMKADEEVKITHKLMKELYEDALHTCITRCIKHDFSKLIFILPEYGGI